MSLRPEQAHWFELLTSREDLAGALEALARTNNVQLETRSETHARLDLTDLHARLEAFGRLERRYHAYWPPPDLSTPVAPGKASDTFDDALQTLRNWEAQASPLIQELEWMKRLYPVFSRHSSQPNRQAKALDWACQWSTAL